MIAEEIGAIVYIAVALITKIILKIKTYLKYKKGEFRYLEDKDNEDKAATIVSCIWPILLPFYLWVLYSEYMEPKREAKFNKHMDKLKQKKIDNER